LQETPRRGAATGVEKCPIPHLAESCGVKPRNPGQDWAEAALNMCKHKKSCKTGFGPKARIKKLARGSKGIFPAEATGHCKVLTF